MTIIDRIEEDLQDKNSHLSKVLEEDTKIKEALIREAELKNKALKDEIDWRNGNYADKSIFPYKDLIFEKEIYPFGW